MVTGNPSRNCDLLHSPLASLFWTLDPNYKTNHGENKYLLKAKTKSRSSTATKTRHRMPFLQVNGGSASKKYLEVSWLEPCEAGSLIPVKTKDIILFYVTSWLPFSPRSALSRSAVIKHQQGEAPEGALSAALVERMVAVISIIYYSFLLSANTVLNLRTQGVCKISRDPTPQGNTFLPSSLTRWTPESNPSPREFQSLSGGLLWGNSLFYLQT